jgi:hypothetical protein
MRSLKSEVPGSYAVGLAMDYIQPRTLSGLEKNVENQNNTF